MYNYNKVEVALGFCSEVLCVVLLYRERLFQ